MASCLLKFERSLTIGLLVHEEYWDTMHIHGLSRYRKDTQTTQWHVKTGNDMWRWAKTRKDTQRRQKCSKLTKTRKEGQRHAKTDKATQRWTKTRKDGQRHAKTDKDTQRGTKTRKDGQRHAKTDKDTQRGTKAPKDGQRHASLLIRVCYWFFFISTKIQPLVCNAVARLPRAHFGW